MKYITIKSLAYIVLGATALLVSWKIYGIIDWSWLWIVSPLWMALGFVVIVLFLLWISGAMTELEKEDHRP